MAAWFAGTRPQPGEQVARPRLQELLREQRAHLVGARIDPVIMKVVIATVVVVVDATVVVVVIVIVLGHVRLCASAASTDNVSHAHLVSEQLLERRQDSGPRSSAARSCRSRASVQRLRWDSSPSAATSGAASASCARTRWAADTDCMPRS